MRRLNILRYLLVPAFFLLPFGLSAQDAVEQARNFLSFSPENPYFPVVLLLGVSLAMLSFFKPRAGLVVMLFFMLISTDMQISDGTAQTGFDQRSTTIRLEDIVLLIVTGGWLLNRAKTRSLSLFKDVPVNMPILFMSLAIVVSTILGYLQGTLQPTRGVLFTMKRLEYFWIFFMTLNIMETDDEVKIATDVLIGLTIFISIVGAIQFFLFPLSGLTGGGATATSGFGRANTLASFYLLAGGVFMGLLIYSQNRVHSLLYMLVLGLSATALIMTKSRGAYLSIPPAVATVVYFSRSKRALLFLVVGGTLFFLYIVGLVIVERFDNKFAHGAQILGQKHTGDIGHQFESIADVAKHGPEGDSSFNARYMAWINGIPVIMKRPIFGHGVGSIPLATYDCQYVRELHETGIVGTLVFLYMNLAVFAAALSLFFMSDDNFTKGLACGFMGGHVGKLVHAWSIENFYTIMNMEVFWFVVALLMILYYNHLNRLEAAPREEPVPVQPDLFGGY